MGWTRAIAAFVLCLAAAMTNGQTVATGLVFDDANGNGMRDRGEAGIPEVRVSNGHEVVRTDEAGRYELPVGDDTIIFVIKPRGWMTRVDGLNLPRFCYVHKPNGSPELKHPGVAPTGPLPGSIDFPLTKRDEPDTFRVIVFGDTQTRTSTDVNYLEHDVLEEVIGCQEAAGRGAAFGISLGDIVYDFLDVFDPVNRAVAHVGVPFYNVMGNHDTNQDTGDDRFSDETWERVYGPPYYSFDYGPVHFVVLDDIVRYWDDEEDESRYRAGLGGRQLEFVKNDLALVPKEQLVVVCMHIPVTQLAEREALFRIMAEHPHCISFSGHSHIQRHMFLDETDGWPGDKPHHHVNFGTACGYWWHGDPDELGIPHATMADGTPNGWWTVTFDGNACSIVFKAARRPADYQMNVYAPEEIAAANVANTEILVNVFAGSERSTVEMHVGKGPWIKMEKVSREDPAIAALGYASKCTHMWQANLPPGLTPGTHLIEVRTTDMFGQTYTGRRLIRVKGDEH
jgi:hypothetical protein